MENIFQHLPNDLIMRIIREADGGRDNHEKKFSGCINAINQFNRVGEVNDATQIFIEWAVYVYDDLMLVDQPKLDPFTPEFIDYCDFTHLAPYN